MTSILDMDRTAEQTLARYRRIEREQGAAQAVRKIAGPLLAEWAHVIRDDGTDTTGLTGLEKLMGERLSIRDAALLSAIDPELDTHTIIDMAARPHTPANRELMNRTLARAFDDPDAEPDHKRIARAVATAMDLAERTKDRKDTAQPLAVAAYLAWWAGEPDAGMTAVNHALDADPDTSLAIMVGSAIQKRRFPAYLTR